MKTAVIVCALVALALGIWVTQVHNRPSRTVNALRASARWTPPRTTIDSAYVTAAGLMLGNGLGDPRGRRFCSMTAALGVVDGHPGLPASVFGWVSPNGKSAVLLDGVEYSGISHVAPADVSKVVGALLLDANDHRPFSSLVLAPAGEYNPALPALLLIANRPDLAEASYAVSPGPTKGDSGPVLAVWLYNRYKELMAEARLEGQLKEGLEYANRFVSVAGIRSQLENAGGPLDQTGEGDRDVRNAQGGIKEFSSKIAHHKAGFGDATGVMGLDEDSRLAALIDGMDAATFAPVTPAASPPRQVMISALGGLGDKAIPVLLDVLQSDLRPVREPLVQGQQALTVRSGRAFGQSYITYSGQSGMETTKDIAWAAIQAIWPMCTRWQKPNTNYPDPVLLRKEWGTDSSLSVPERWLEVLQDDNAGEQLWLQASDNLTKRAAPNYLPSGGRQGLTDAPLVGDPLRPKHGSDIERLLARRCLQITAARAPNAYMIPNQSEGLAMANQLYRWHPAASLQCLQTACKHAMIVPEQLPQPPGRPNVPQQQVQYNGTLDGPFAMAIAERSILGDKSAAADYAAYATHVSSSSYLGGPPFLLPLWKAPSDAGIQAVGETLFHHWQEDLDISDANKVLETVQRMLGGGQLQRLLLLRPFRTMLAHGLAKNGTLGIAAVTSTGARSPAIVNFSIGTNVRMSWMVAQGDVAPQGPISVSTGDFIARSLSEALNPGNQGRNGSGCPQFQIYWPSNVRSQAKSSMIAWLSNDSVDWPKAVAQLPKANDDE